MLFWLAVLSLSLVMVLLIAAPILKRARKESENLKPAHLGALLALAAAPILAAAIYVTVGAPESLSPTFQEAMKKQAEDPAAAIAAMSEEDRAAMIDDMVAGLAARLEEDPTDAEGWRMLARSYLVLGRTKESEKAYAELLALDGKATVQDWRDYIGVLLTAFPPEDGPFDEKIIDALKRLQEFNKDDPMALFYLGLAARAEGDRKTALANWRRLAEVIPPDAPIMDQLQSLIAELESASE